MIVELVAALALAPAQLPPLPPLPPLPIPPLPPPPAACLIPPLPPICLPPEPIPPSDDPPRLEELELRRDGAKHVVLTWPAATDDVGVWGYRLYRDGNYIARFPADRRRARLLLPCGAHSYRVEAVDTVEQTASRSRRVVRRCGAN
jgi:hypothetical protein